MKLALNLGLVKKAFKNINHQAVVVITTLALFPSLSFATGHNLSPENLPLLDTTFKYAGPNCFGTALLGAGIYDNIRGVDISEFNHVLESSCEEVDTPALGDIGVFESSGYMAVHAFMYINDEIAYEKQGVDYDGETSINLIKLRSVKYRVEADPFCRRFGDESCYNKLKYFRCSSYEKPKALLDFEAKIELMLRGFADYSKDELVSDIRSLKSSGKVHESILQSIDAQMTYIFRDYVSDENRVLLSQLKLNHEAFAASFK